jgi:hypothetical protein
MTKASYAWKFFVFDVACYFYKLLIFLLHFIVVSAGIEGNNFVVCKLVTDRLIKLLPSFY